MRDDLVDTFAFIPPARALEQLTSDEATRRIPGMNHSIAEVVGHMTFWQAWFLDRCRGVAQPVVGAAAEGWPAVAPGEWEALRERFLAGAEQAAVLSETPDVVDQPIAPAIDLPQLAHYTVRQALVHVAIHNAHHLGQVIAMRQVLGTWPPPSGSWTW